jgi:NAD(P)-dependent dehydrogenase (short-subunit alcohol dehydrogenase family)
LRATARCDREIARDLAAHGFTVLVGSRNLERGEVAAEEAGPNARALQLDVLVNNAVISEVNRRHRRR